MTFDWFILYMYTAFTPYLVYVLCRYAIVAQDEINVYMFCSFLRVHNTVCFPVVKHI